MSLSAEVELICSRKGLPTATCLVPYGLRDCPDSFAKTLELAEGSGNVDLLEHLLLCVNCREHIAAREKSSSQEERDVLVRDALARVKKQKGHRVAP
jgi:hypothetical protein